MCGEQLEYKRSRISDNGWPEVWFLRVRLTTPHRLKLSYNGPEDGDRLSLL